MFAWFVVAGERLSNSARLQKGVKQGLWWLVKGPATLHGCKKE